MEWNGMESVPTHTTINNNNNNNNNNTHNNTHTHTHTQHTHTHTHTYTHTHTHNTHTHTHATTHTHTHTITPDREQGSTVLRRASAPSRETTRVSERLPLRGHFGAGSPADWGSSSARARVAPGGRRIGIAGMPSAIGGMNGNHHEAYRFVAALAGTRVARSLAWPASHFQVRRTDDALSASDIGARWSSCAARTAPFGNVFRGDGAPLFVWRQPREDAPLGPTTASCSCFGVILVR